MKPLPKTNMIDNKRKILFVTAAFNKALYLTELRFCDSTFSFEIIIKPKPQTNNSSINSSAKLVVNVSNIFVSINDEKTANTGIVNRKSNQR
jgi:hypothetical protein